MPNSPSIGFFVGDIVRVLDGWNFSEPIPDDNCSGNWLEGDTGIVTSTFYGNHIQYAYVTRHDQAIGQFIFSMLEIVTPSPDNPEYYETCWVCGSASVGLCLECRWIGR